MKGNPMVLKRETHGDGIPEGWEILIIYGITEGAMKAQLAPLMDADTKIISDPRL